MNNADTILFATRNKGKMAEIKKYFQGTKYHILSLDDMGVDINVVEDGATFEENAAKKAAEICHAAGVMVLADDSGLVVDAMAGAPGVDSANFLGTDTPYNVRNLCILRMMADVPYQKRTARFVCVIAIARPGHDVITVRGELSGFISQEMHGEGGFGYDPIFFVAQKGKTTAQMTIEEKNAVSHRGAALALALKELDAL